MHTSRIVHLGVLAALVALGACDDAEAGGAPDVEVEVDGADAASDAVDAADAEAVEDTRVEDAEDTDADAVEDAQSDAVEDAAVQDAEADAVQDADAAGPDVPDGCEALTATAEAALAEAGAGCDAPTACRAFEHPICGSFGCFQGAVREGADLTSLVDAATEAQLASCPPFHCGCGFPEGQPVCLDGACRACPPDCGGDCDDLREAIEATAAEVAAGCETDEDCQATAVDVCAMGPHINCHAVAWRTSPEPVLRLLEGWEDTLGCPVSACDCQFQAAECNDEGLCVPVQQ